MPRYGYFYRPEPIEDGDVTDYGWWPSWAQLPTGEEDDKYVPDNEFDWNQYQGFLAGLAAFGEWREIVTLFDNPNRFVRRCKVIWSTDALKQMPLAGQGGIYYEGDVMMTIRKTDLAALPQPELCLESPPGLVWRITDVVDDAGTYTLKLVRNS